MSAARESGKEPPELGALEPTSRKKKKTRVAVSVRKGNLLFFPTALPDAYDTTGKPESRDQEEERKEI